MKLIEYQRLRSFIALAKGQSDFEILSFSEIVRSCETKVHMKAYGLLYSHSHNNVPLRHPPRTEAERIHGRGTGRHASVHESLWENRNENSYK